MSKPEPPIHWDNVFIFSQFQYQAMAVFLFPLIAVTVCFFSFAPAWDACSVGSCVSFQRLGAFWSAAGFLYVLAEEIWKVTPRLMHEEIELSFARIDDDGPGVLEAKRRFRQFAEFTDVVRKPMIRTVETLMVVGGTMLAGFGDLLGIWLKGILH